MKKTKKDSVKSELEKIIENSWSGINDNCRKLLTESLDKINKLEKELQETKDSAIQALEKEYRERIKDLESSNDSLSRQIKEMGEKFLSVREVMSTPWFYRTRMQRDFIDRF
jgi:preprotein translocase subunit SecA